jgi:hypothetical protein
VLHECKALSFTDLAMFKWSEDVVPTVAFNFRKVRKGNVVLKIWDVAGNEYHLSIAESPTYGVLIGLQVNQSFAPCGNVIATESTPWCMETSLLFVTTSEIGPTSFVVDSTDVR